MELESHFDEQTKLIHALLYGATKTKKTWWMGTAAELGFNVTILFCDREGGLNILKNLSDEARQKIKVIDIQDRPDRPVSAHFISRFCKGRPFLWNQNDKSVIWNEEAVNPEHYHVCVRPALLNENDVLGFDSWTSHIESIYAQFDAENAIDPADAKKIEWDGYGWSRRTGTWHLNYLSHLPCHLIIIGHQQFYEKKKRVREDGKYVEKVIWSRTQVTSTSGPHSQIVPQRFDDIFYFFMEGNTIKIDTRPDQHRDGGSSIVPPDIYLWDKLKFDRVAEMSGVKYRPELEDKPKAFTFFKPGETISFEELGILQVVESSFAKQAQASKPPAINAANAQKSQPKSGTFAALASKQKEG